MAAGLGEVRFAKVKKEVVMAGIGFILAGTAFMIPTLLGARVMWIPLLPRVALAGLLVIVGGLLAYVGFRRIAFKTGWTPLLEGFGGWFLFSLIAAVLFAHSGWTMSLQWVGLVDTEEDQVAVILYSVLAAIIGVLLLFLAAASIAPSIYLARNLLRGSPYVGVADHAVFVYKVASILSILVYPLAGVAASLAAIGIAVATSHGEVAVRATVAARGE